MSTNHKPTGLASLPRPPHHGLPDPPLACAVPPGSRSEYGRNHFGQQRPTRPPGQLAATQPSRLGQNGNQHRDSFRGPNRAARPIGRDYAQGPHGRGNARQSHSPMMHPSYYQSPALSNQQGQGWAFSYDESGRIATNGSHSHSHPSPASTSSGSTSSLRTPPDLLLNGNTIGHVYPAWKSSPHHPMLALNSWSGLALKRPLPPRHLSVRDIEKRIELLNDLPADLSLTLPSPPLSPTSSPWKGKARMRGAPTGDRPESDVGPGELIDASRVAMDQPKSRFATKQNQDDGLTFQDQPQRTARKRRRSEDGSIETSKQRMRQDGPSASLQHASRSGTIPPAPASDREEEDGEVPDAENVTNAKPLSSDKIKMSRPVDVPDASAPRPPLLPRAWTKDSLAHAATIYRNRGRERKHAGDQLAEKAASSIPTFASPKAIEVAALEQLDAVLLFCYAFYLSDQESGSQGCLASNWLSLFGLLRYATSAHSRLRNDSLVGLCRLIEASTLRILHTHDQRLLRNRLAATRQSSTGPDSAASHDVSALSEGFFKLSSDLERSDRLASQATHLLSMATLKKHFPETWSSILKNDEIVADSTALSVNPGSWPIAESFAWPVGPTTPISHLVCFGRNLLREHAKRRGIDFEPVEIRI